MNKRYIKHLAHRIFPTIAKYKKTLYRFIENSIPFFYPQIFKRLRTMKKCEEHDKNQNGQEILIFATRQDPLHIVWELILYKALMLRGQNVNIVACDGLIRNGCNESWYPSVPVSLCKVCYKFAHKLYGLAGVNVIWLSEFLDNENCAGFKGGEGILEKKFTDKLPALEIGQLRNFKYRGFSLGEMVRPSVGHFSRNEDIEEAAKEDHRVRKIYENFLVNSIGLTDLVENLLDRMNPDLIMMINGRFAAEAVMFNWARKKNIRTVVYESGILPDSMSFLHNQHIDYSKLTDWEKRKKTKLTDEESKKLDAYIMDRKTGAGQLADYWDESQYDLEKMKSDIGIDHCDTISTLFPNILFDSANHGKNVQYKTMGEWIDSTIKFFAQNTKHALIIRVHPAEIKWPQVQRDSVLSYIKKRHPNLPANIKIIKPQENYNSYALMEMADIGLVSTSTSGMEMALLNKPVVVTGKVHYYDRGFTIDPKTDEEYHETLHRLLNKQERVNLDFEAARTYAYHIFFESSYQLKALNGNNYRLNPPELLIDEFNELAPGNDPQLDSLCNSIVNNTDFEPN